MHESATLETQRHLIATLQRTLENDHGRPLQLIETHISWVLVDADLAYKFKKALHFDFLDFSTLEARRFYCMEELRLNRRLAPAIYLDVVAIGGSAEQPVLNGGGAAIEYAVKMQAFEQQALWSWRLQNQLITPPEIDALAQKIARFHLAIPSAPEGSAWGEPAGLRAISDDSFAVIRTLTDTPESRRQLAELSAWLDHQHAHLHQVFLHRRQAGFIRECHGDLHSNNILTWRERVEVFDCIEFNDGLRWIDVMNDLAFILMDLEFRGRPDLAARMLNRSLQESGDYEGLTVLRYYRIERALVRSKVACLRAGQANAANAADAATAAAASDEARRYLALAARDMRPGPAAIMITHGFSGSGKSVFSRALLELLGAVQIRSDLERKRMHGLAATDYAGAAPGDGIYATLFSESTYRRLLELARLIVAAGLPVIVDAAFLKKEQRDLFAALARELALPFVIFDLHADVGVLLARVVARRAEGIDPSDAGPEVLAQQLATAEALAEDELAQSLPVDTSAVLSQDMLEKIAAAVRARGHF